MRKNPNIVEYSLYKSLLREMAAKYETNVIKKLQGKLRKIYERAKETNQDSDIEKGGNSVYEYYNKGNGSKHTFCSISTYL